MFFGWLRRKAAEAVVLGVGDGLRAVAPDGDEPPADLDGLRALLAAAAQPKALPPAEPGGEDAGEDEARPVKSAAAGRKK